MLIISFNVWFDWEKKDKTRDPEPADLGSGIRQRFPGLTVTGFLWTSCRYNWRLSIQSMKAKETIMSTKNLLYKLQALKNSPFEMPVNFAQKIGYFTKTNCHGDQKVIEYDKCQIIFKKVRMNSHWSPASNNLMKIVQRSLEKSRQ